MLKLAAIAFICAFTLIAVGMGWSIVGRLDARKGLDKWERLAIAFGLGALVTHFGVFFVGRWRLDSLSMGGLAVVLAIAAIPGLRAMPWPALRDDVRTQWHATRQDIVLAGMWLTLIAVALSGLLQGLAPPNDYDSLMYHLSLPQYDIEVGKITTAWRWTAHAFFPVLIENLYRLGLALVGEPVAQMQHGTFALIAALAAARLTHRFGFGRKTALTAALMFLSIRVVVWEMATCEVDLALAAYMTLALLAYMAWREKEGVGLSLLFGLMLGGALNAKYLGFSLALSYAPVILADIWQRRKRFIVIIGQQMVGALSVVACIMTQLIYNFVHTHNPVFPLFNKFFNPDGFPYFADLVSQYGIGREAYKLLLAPWYMSVAPNQNFDGMVLGAPYLLAFLPFAVLAGRRHAGAVVASMAILTYYVQWFWLLSQQVRFLLPILPLIAVFSATGATVFWQSAKGPGWKVIIAALMGSLALNQAAFVGIYAAIRLPAALGFISPLEYHSKTPTLGGAFYKTCIYVRERLLPGNAYLSLLSPHFYYCPQSGAITNNRLDSEVRFEIENKALPALTAEEFLSAMETANIQFVIVQTLYEHRRNETGQPELRALDAEGSRFGHYIMPTLQEMKPLSQDAISAVYDGHEVLKLLRRRVEAQK